MDVDSIAGTEEARRIVLGHVVVDQAILAEGLSGNITLSTASPVGSDTLQISVK
jgi:hypothetical protein